MERCAEDGVMHQREEDGVPKTAVRTVEAELLSRLREKDWEPAAADNTPKEPETEVVTGLVMLAARTQSGAATSTTNLAV